jgi:Domain of unknown function (DUF5017)
MKYVIYLMFIGCLFTSCKKIFEKKLDDFNVKLLNSPSKVGDTARFAIEGNPDFITFYSGENGNNYDNRNRTTADSIIPQISFTSNVQNLSPLHPNSLTLWVATNYSEDTFRIVEANWVDITARAVLSKGISDTNSGVISLADFKNNESIYVAFKYNTVAGVNAIQPTWTIKSFNHNNLSFPDSTLHNINTISNAGWQVADLSNNSKRWTVSTSQLSLTGDVAFANGHQDWAIVKLFPKRVNSDLGIPIKQIFEKINSFAYPFTKAGKYKVVFVAKNNNFSNFSETLRSFEITINN